VNAADLDRLPGGRIIRDPNAKPRQRPMVLTSQTEADKAADRWGWRAFIHTRDAKAS
jgi:hypothetical protein